MAIKGKDFRIPKVSYIDYKQIDIGRVLLNLFPRLKFDGRAGRIQEKNKYDIETFVAEFTSPENQDKFLGFADHPKIVEEWLRTELLDLVNRGKPNAAVVAPRPLHGNVYKFRNTSHARDYNTSEQVYWMLYHARGPLGQGVRDDLKRFLFPGLDPATDKVQITGNIDVETQAILHLDRQKKDKADSKEPEIQPPLCIGQADIMADDIRRMLAYESYMPRTEIIEALKTLLSFHLGLYHLRLMKLLPFLVNRGSGDTTCLPRNCPANPKNHKAQDGCPYQIALVVDVIGEVNHQMAELARRSADLHYRRIPSFIHAQFVVKKLDEFVDNLVSQCKLLRPEERDFTVAELLEFLKPKHKYKNERDSYFGMRFANLIEELKEGGDGDLAPEISRILEMGLSDFEAFIEILVTLRSAFHKTFILKCLDSLLMKNQESGILRQPGRQGRGKGRRFFMGTRLLEVLLQIAVLRPSGASFKTGEIRIEELLDWLVARYGLYIDRLPEQFDSIGAPSITDRQALRGNFEAFKARLREIGFFQDLSDAYITQTVSPRYTIG
jgi:hypothetical protein